MYLTDTSIWIDLFNNNTTEYINKLFENEQLSLSSTIYFEVLQGTKNKNLFNKIKNVLLEQNFYNLQHNHQSYEQAAQIYRSCRKQGITIRSSIDCLIAQCAIENDLILLHNDKDFDKIASIIPTLKTQKV